MHKKRRIRQSRLAEPAHHRERDERTFAGAGSVPYREENQFEDVRLEDLDGLFGTGCSQTLVDDLTALGFEDPQALRFQVESGLISKTRRGVRALNIYRAGEDMQVESPFDGERFITNMAMRYLVKNPNPGEEAHAFAQGCGMASRIIHQCNVDGLGGAIQVERYARYGTGIPDVGGRLNGEEARAFGSELGRHFNNMIENGVLYDFGKYALTHTRILVGEEGEDSPDLRVLLLDWSNNIDISGLGTLERTRAIVTQMRYIAAICRNLSNLTGPLAWQGFAESFPNAPTPNPMGDRAIELQRIRSHMNRNQGLVERVERDFAGEGETLDDDFAFRQQRGWVRFFMRALEQEPYAKREFRPTERQHSAHRNLISENLRALGSTDEDGEAIVTGLARSIQHIVVDIGRSLDNHNELVADEQRIDPLKIGFGSECVEVSGREVLRLSVKFPEPESKTLCTYEIYKAEDVGAVVAASQAMVGEPCLYVDRRQTQAVVRRDGIPFREYEITSPLEAEWIGGSLASILDRSYRTRIIPSFNADNLVLLQRPGLQANRVRGIAFEAGNLAENREQLDSCVKGIAEVLKAENHGQVAWRVFASTITSMAVDMGELEQYAASTQRLENSLEADPQWSEFFEQSRKVMWDTPELTLQHADFLGYLSQRDPLIGYSPESLTLLRGIEPVLRSCVETLSDKDFVECPWLSIPEIRVALPIRSESGMDQTPPLSDARLGNLKELSDFALLVELSPYQRNTRRFRDIGSTALLVPVEGGQIQSFRKVSLDRGLEGFGYVYPEAFKAHLKPEGGHMDYSIVWDEKSFSGLSPHLEGLSEALAGRSVAQLSADEREELSDDLMLVAKEADLERAWGKAERVAFNDYPSWQGILHTCRGRLDSLDDLVDKYHFVVGVEFPTRIAAKVDSGLASALNPRSKRMFEDEEFELYAEIPEVLERTIDRCFPTLTDNVTDFLTVLGIMPRVREREAELKRRLNIREYRELLRGCEPVELADENPAGFIKGIRYLRNLNRYVLYFDFNVEGEGEHELVLKCSNMAADLTSSSLGEVMGQLTSRVWPAATEWGLEAFIPGMTPLEDPSTCNAEPRVYCLKEGEYAATVAMIPTHPHAKNVVKDSRTGLWTLFDQELETAPSKSYSFYPNCGYLIGWGCLPALTHLEGWKPREDPAGTLKLWRDFTRGMHIGYGKYLAEKGSVRSILESSHASGIGINVDEVERRLEVSPEKKIKDTVRFMLETHASYHDPERKDDFWSELSEFWSTVAGWAGLTAADIRWEEIVDQTMIGREVLQQDPNHQALRGPGRLEDYEKKWEEAHKRGLIERRIARLKANEDAGEEVRGPYIVDKQTGKLIRERYDGD
ncbi:MAG: hypothetical protein ABH851_04175 [Methanobacteriota archaeon]